MALCRYIEVSHWSEIPMHRLSVLVAWRDGGLMPVTIVSNPDRLLAIRAYACWDHLGEKLFSTRISQKLFHILSLQSISRTQPFANLNSFLSFLTTRAPTIDSGRALSLGLITTMSHLRTLDKVVLIANLFFQGHGLGWTGFANLNLLRRLCHGVFQVKTLRWLLRSVILSQSTLRFGQLDNRLELAWVFELNWLRRLAEGVASNIFVLLLRTFMRDWSFAELWTE